MIARLKKPWNLLSALSVLGLLAMSCAPATAPAPTAKPAVQASPPTSAPLETKPAGPTPTPRPAGEQPRSGGVLNTTLNSDMPSLDVQQETGLIVQATVQCAYSGLLQFNPADPDKIVADLAESWDISPDGTVYTFHLHKGVKFHDGSNLTSADVKFSLERIIDPPKNVISPRKATLAGISEITAPDPDTVKITLKYAQSSILPMLAVGQIVIYPRKVVEAKGDMKKDVVGTGPFMFKDYSPGTIFEVKKNASYFLKGLPYLDGVRFYIIRDDSTKISAFRTAQVKLVDPSWTEGLRPSQVQLIRKEMPQATLVKFPSLSSRWLNMVVTTPPFDDVRVRRAVSMAIDRQVAAKVLAEGEADIGTVMVSGSDWAMPEADLLKLPGFRQPKDADIAEAKKLLAEAGSPNGFKTRMLARSKYTDDMAVLMKEQLARIGIDLEIVVQESAVFLEQINKLGFPTVGQPIGVRMTDPDEFSRYFVSGAGSNWTGLKNSDVDALFEKQGRALDVAERKKIVRDLDNKLLELVPSVALYWQRGNIAHWPEVKNYYRGNPYNNNKLQNVWLAK